MKYLLLVVALAACNSSGSVVAEQLRKGSSNASCSSTSEGIAVCEDSHGTSWVCFVATNSSQRAACIQGVNPLRLP